MKEIKDGTNLVEQVNGTNNEQVAEKVARILIETTFLPIFEEMRAKAGFGLYYIFLKTGPKHDMMYTTTLDYNLVRMQYIAENVMDQMRRIAGQYGICITKQDYSNQYVFAWMPQETNQQPTADKTKEIEKTFKNLVCSEIERVIKLNPWVYDVTVYVTTYEDSKTTYYSDEATAGRALEAQYISKEDLDEMARNAANYGIIANSNSSSYCFTMYLRGNITKAQDINAKFRNEMMDSRVVELEKRRPR